MIKPQPRGIHSPDQLIKAGARLLLPPRSVPTGERRAANRPRSWRYLLIWSGTFPSRLHPSGTQSVAEQTNLRTQRCLDEPRRHELHRHSQSQRKTDGNPDETDSQPPAGKLPLKKKNIFRPGSFRIYKMQETRRKLECCRHTIPTKLSTK